MTRHANRARCDVEVISPPSLHDALQLLDAAIVTSGTATLETALAGVPMVVVYRTSWPTYLAAKAVVRVPDIGLVNVVAGKRIAPELVQAQATPTRIERTLVELLRNDERAATMRRDLQDVRASLGSTGAVDRAAAAVCALL